MQLRLEFKRKGAQREAQRDAENDKSGNLLKEVFVGIAIWGDVNR